MSSNVVDGIAADGSSLPMATGCSHCQGEDS